MAAKGQYRVPYNPEGSLLHHAVEKYSGKLVTWRDNVPFEASLVVTRHRRGRSAAYFVWEDDEGREYPMFMKDIFDIFEHAKIDRGGRVTSWWTVSKCGQNYGIKLHSED